MQKKVLVVDDSAVLRQKICELVESHGLSTSQSGNGIEALDYLSKDTCDMIFTDINMPQMDGIELIGEVRKLEKFKFVPIVFITTESNSELKNQAKKAGATAWITKPFTDEMIGKVLKKVLR